MRVKQILTGVALVYGFTFIGGFIIGVAAAASGLPAPVAMVGVMASNLVLSVVAFCIAGVLIKTERFKGLLVVALICWLLSALNMSLIPTFTVLQWAFGLVFIVPDALVQNYAPTVQDFQLLHTSRRDRSRARCGRTGTAGTLSRG